MSSLSKKFSRMGRDMRTLISGRLHDWRARAGAVWTGLNGRAASHLDLPDNHQTTRLTAHAVAAVVVAGAFLLQWLLGRADEPRFWLFNVAVALTAAYGRVAPTLVAILLSMLVARLSSGVSLSTAALFGVEALLIGLVVLRMGTVIQPLRRRLEGAVRQFTSAEGERTRLDRALTRLEQALANTAVILLDRAGHVSVWRSGATRLYGFSSGEMVTAGAAALFDEPGQTAFHGLLTEARDATTRRSCRQRRADGTTFEAEIEVSPLAPDARDGFTMIVRDLTPQQARAADARSTAETHAHLRGEVELAQQQLWTLQELTDPTLNLLAADEFAQELLDRLRSAIYAEGVALVHFGRHRPHLLCASEGLQSQRVRQGSGVAMTTGRARAVMIHNDPAAAAEVSAAVWPDAVSSLIAVPLVRAGSATAVLEVVNRTGRRATEWEIALVQVVAARIAGVLEDESSMNAAAEARPTSGTSSGPSALSESELRLTLDEDVYDTGESASFPSPAPGVRASQTSQS
jgi:PAS domain S-box-containing protein